MRRIAILPILALLFLGCDHPTQPAVTSASDFGVGLSVAEGAPPATFVFDSNRDGATRNIYTMAVDGSNVQLIASQANQAAWSPDGLRIAFIKFGAVHVMYANGTGVTQIGSSPTEQGPTWSPDGSKIAYIGCPPGLIFPAGCGPGTSNLFRRLNIMNPDGSGKERVTLPENDGLFYFNVDWAPDGTRYVVTRGGFPKTIWVIAADGSSQAQLTDGFSDATVRWRPVIPRAPKDELADLLKIVIELELARGLERALSATLEAALASLENDRPAAVQQLEAFITQVEGMREQLLTDEEADELTSAARHVIDVILATS